MDSPVHISRSDSYSDGELEYEQPSESSREGPQELRRPDVSTQLPTELLLMIVEHLANDPSHTQPWDERHSMSELSTVCYSWSRQLRPRLFSKLSLRSAADMHFLLEMLRGRDNQWLSAAIVELEIIIYENNANSWFDRFCKLVSNRLTALQRFTCRSNLDHLSLSSRPFFASHRHLKTLSISGFQFPSFSAFARLLGELQSLEDLKCSEIYWAYEEVEGRPLARMPPFHALRRIVCTGMASPWIMALLFSPRIARHYVPYDDQLVHGSPEAWMLVLLSKMALNKHPQTDGLTIFRHGDEIMIHPPTRPPDQGRIGQINIQFWPTAEVIPDESLVTISAIRRIVLCSNGILSDGWGYLDCRLTQRIKNFECLTVLYDDPKSGEVKQRERFMRCFPRLRRLGSFQFRMRLSTTATPFSGELINLPYEPKDPARVVPSEAIDFADQRGVPAFQDPDYSSYDAGSHKQVLFVQPLKNTSYYINIDGQGYFRFVHEASATELSGVLGGFPFTRKAMLEHVSRMLLEHFPPGGAIAAEDIYVLRIDRYEKVLQPILAFRPDLQLPSSH